MATIEQARQQLQTQQQLLTQQKQTLQQARAPTLTRAQLLKQTPTSALQQRQVQQRFQQQKVQALKQIGIQEKQLAGFETQIKKAEAQQKAIQAQRARQAQIQETIQRIARGRPVGDIPKDILNRAIDVIAQDPALRRRIEGGIPTGLSPERTEALIAGLKFAELGDPSGLVKPVELPSITLPPIIEQAKVPTDSRDFFEIMGITPKYTLPEEFRRIVELPKLPPMTIAPSVELGLPPTPPIDAFKELGIPTVTPLPEFLEKPVEQFKVEQQRYQDLGFKVSEARKLATESLRVGGVTVTPARAADILVGPLGSQVKREQIGAKISRGIEIGKEVLRRELIPTIKGPGFEIAPMEVLVEKRIEEQRRRELYVDLAKKGYDITKDYVKDAIDRRIAQEKAKLKLIKEGVELVSPFVKKGVEFVSPVIIKSIEDRIKKEQAKLKLIKEGVELVSPSIKKAIEKRIEIEKAKLKLLGVGVEFVTPIIKESVEQRIATEKAKVELIKEGYKFVTPFVKKGVEFVSPVTQKLIQGAQRQIKLLKKGYDLASPSIKKSIERRIAIETEKLRLWGLGAGAIYNLLKGLPSTLKEELTQREKLVAEGERVIDVPVFGTGQRDPFTGEMKAFERVELPEHMEPTLLGGTLALGKIPSKVIETTGIIGEKGYEALMKDVPEERKLAYSFLGGPVKEITPEQIGKVTELGVLGGALFIPGAVPTILTSDVITAQQEYMDASKIAKKEVEKQYKEHLKIELKEGEKHLTKKEFITDLLPKLEQQIKRNALIEGGVSLAFLGTGAGLKLLSSTARTGAEAELKVLQKVKPDVSVGVVKKAGEVDKLLIKTIRRTDKAKSETVTTFNIRKTGEKTFQIEKGRGVSQITIEGKVLDPSKFTFAGAGQETLARKVIQRELSKGDIIKLKKDLKGLDSSVGDVRIIFGATDDLTVVKKPFFGIAEKPKIREIEMLKEKDEGLRLIEKPKIKTTRFLGGEIEELVTPTIGKGKPSELGVLIEVPKAPPKPKVFDIIGKPSVIKDIEGFAEKLVTDIEKRIPFKPKDKIIDTGKLITIIEPEEELIRKGVIGVTAEQEALKLAKIKVEPPKIFGKEIVQPPVLKEVSPLDKMIGVLPPKEVAIPEMLPSVVEIPIVPKLPIKIQIPKRKMEKRVDVISVPDITLAQKIDLSQRLKVKQVQKQAPVKRIESVLGTRTITELKPAVRTIPAMTAILQAQAKARARAKAVVKAPISVRPKIVPPIVTPEIKGRPVTKTPTKPVKGKEGYGYEIRRKGKWQRVNLPFAFATKEGAEAKAMTQVQREAAASYRLVKSKKPVKKSFRKPTALQKVLFRPGKEKGVMVQKKLLRITTPGEVREISLVGVAARRKQKKKVVKKKVKKVSKKSKRRTKKK